MINIIINQELMITFVYVGAENDSVLSDLLNEVKMSKIEEYLKK